MSPGQQVDREMRGMLCDPVDVIELGQAIRNRGGPMLTWLTKPTRQQANSHRPHIFSKAAYSRR